jgi:hypothetical protein
MKIYCSKDITSAFILIASVVDVGLHLPGGLQSVHVVICLGSPPLELELFLLFVERRLVTLRLLRDNSGLLPVLDHVRGASPAFFVEVFGVLVVVSPEIALGFFLRKSY